ncbi:hypothetical protein GCM10010358_83510 [Streptomyces minutiscleroticus]|uniref:Transposase n=1 Tax=Streptomyces minutiscleroticus TaxID=68238 RepID=A0A918UB97_9ACTN|nr:hypothetical protein GCM10010358_83510 [Streptomyces minutiscleroticus]
MSARRARATQLPRVVSFTPRSLATSAVRTQLTTVAGMLGRQFPQVEAMLTEAAEDVTAFADFPVAHWKKIWSTDEIVKAGRG